jgi:hypothetical protein
MIHVRTYAVAVLTTLLAWPSVVAAQAGGAQGDSTRDANLRAYAELLRSDLRSQKAALITELVPFTPDEDAKFWPIYRDYEAELAKINTDRMNLISEYAEQYETLTDPQADQLARRALDLESRRNALVASYYDRLTKALPAKTAVQVLQVERQILLLFDLQVNASLPIVDKSAGK